MAKVKNKKGNFQENEWKRAQKKIIKNNNRKLRTNTWFATEGIKDIFVQNYRV